jgi:SAM-dependent MidA family methyltransferase
MPDPDSSLPAAEVAGNYPTHPAPATPSLAALLRQKIHDHGPLAFSEFMALALYEPTHGYYAQAPRQVGRSGDFFTSVSVGPLFGELLARRFLREWRELGSPGRWRILECGAHDGTLAADILDALARLHPLAFAACEYAIPEPLPRLQAAQRETLSRFHKKMRFTQNTVDLEADPLPGVAFGNELLDALPFHLIEWQAGCWRECHVGISPSGTWIWAANREITEPQLLAALAPLGSHFPENYRTEVRTNYTDFLAPLTRCLSSGLLLWPDYGFARPDYYLPSRTTGTLRTFSQHRAAEDPLATPGEIDITAHVDFTAVTEAALALGCKPRLFHNQGAWLTEVGREWLLHLEGNPDPTALRQFLTLTHPAHLGSRFHCLELSWQRLTPPLSATDHHRLAL